VAEGGVKSASAVGPEEVAEMGAEVGWEEDIKSIFVVMVGSQALLQLRRFIKYRATQFEGRRGERKELLLLCSIAIYIVSYTRERALRKSLTNVMDMAGLYTLLCPLLYSVEREFRSSITPEKNTSFTKLKV
jgi:hypothetical protein